jgi:hypothetical protein
LSNRAFLVERVVAQLLHRICADFAKPHPETSSRNLVQKSPQGGGVGLREEEKGVVSAFLE